MSNFNEADLKKLEELSNAIINEEDPDKAQSMIEELLALDPQNPLAKYMKWCNMDEEESEDNLNLLTEAIDELRPMLDDENSEFARSIRPEFAMMLSDLSSMYFLKGEFDKALKVAEEFMDVDSSGNLIGRMVYYSTLIKKGEYERLTKVADSDEFKTPLSEFSRALALFELGGASEDATDALLEAISLDSEMIFYIMGLWELEEDALDNITDDDEAAYMEEFQMQAGVLMDLWVETEERLAFISTVAFTFGYLTGRISEPDDIEMLENGYRNLGCYDAMSDAREELLTKIDEGTEAYVIDEEAIMRFQELRAKGMFS